LGRHSTRALSPEGCKERRRHQQGRPSLGCRSGRHSRQPTPSARWRIGNVWETKCWQPSRDGRRTSTNCCRASARRIGTSPAIIPSGSARYKNGALSFDLVQNKFRLSWNFSFPETPAFDQAGANLDPQTFSGPFASRLGLTATMVFRDFAQGRQAAEVARQVPVDDSLPDMLTILLAHQARN